MIFGKNLLHHLCHFLLVFLYRSTQLPANRHPETIRGGVESEFVSVDETGHLHNWSVTDTSTCFATKATADMEDWSETACTKCP